MTSYTRKLILATFVSLPFFQQLLCEYYEDILNYFEPFPYKVQ